MNSEVIAWEAMLKQIQESGLLAEESKRRAEEEANRASLLRREYEALLEEVRGKKKAIEEEGKKRIEDLVAQGRRQIEASHSGASSPKRPPANPSEKGTGSWRHWRRRQIRPNPMNGREARRKS